MTTKVMFCLLAAGSLALDAAANCAEMRLKALVDSGELPGAVTIFKNDGREERTCLGWADVEKKVPMREDTLFMVCSQTKGVCGVACAILIDDGKVQLDDPIEKYLPEFKDLRVRVTNTNGTESLVAPAEKLTLRHCLSHTGGFPYEGPVLKTYGWAAAPLRIRATVNAAVPLVRQPGTRYCYSNTGIDIAGAVVEQVSGMKFDEFLESRLFKPLGMNETWFDPPPEALQRLATNYRLIPGKRAEPYPVHYTRRFDEKERRWPCPSAGLYSTPRDFVKFYEMIMNKGVGANGVRVLKAETVTEILGKKQTPAAVGANYSLGLNVSGGWIGHSGALQTYCEVNPEKRQLRMWMVQLRGEAGGYIVKSDVIDAIRKAGADFTALR